MAAATTRQPVPALALRMASRIPFLTFGYRPFFLFAGVYGAVAIVLWLLILYGHVALPGELDPVVWHQHEMIFGFAAAAIAGFLLTAVPNWTGRLPVAGWPLGLLVALWLAGRGAVFATASIGPWPAAVIDGAFLPVFAAVVLREIVAGRNWRNAKVAIPVALLALCNLAVHAESVGLVEDSARPALRLAIFLVLTLIAIVGGRIVPSFTRNWLVKRGAAALPKSYTALDGAAVGLVPVLGLAFVVFPDSPATAALALAAALVHALRLALWRGYRTGAEPLVWILHVGYAWLPIGFAIVGAALFVDDVDIGAALHALTAGAFGTMTLAVMTRASLGHSGRPLVASRATTLCYLLVIAAALVRVAAPIGGWPVFGYEASAALWVAAFGLFSVTYFPVLVLPRKAA
ncbi:MAG: NnrS family protein [Candidatus Eiseniibacteriota bacterium]